MRSRVKVARKKIQRVSATEGLRNHPLDFGWGSGKLDDKQGGVREFPYDKSASGRSGKSNLVRKPYRKSLVEDAKEDSGSARKAIDVQIQSSTPLRVPPSQRENKVVVPSDGVKSIKIKLNLGQKEEE